MKKFIAFAIFLLLISNASARCASCSPNFVCETVVPDACPAGQSCLMHDDNCGNWEALEAQFPPAKRMNEAEEKNAQSKSSAICEPGTKGPKLPKEYPHELSTLAQGNWLLTMALIRMGEVANKGIFDNGSFSFPLAESPDTKQLALAGKEVPYPEEVTRFNDPKGFYGYAEYSTRSEGKRVDDPTMQSFYTEMRIWRVNNEKFIPTHGMKVRLYYEKNPVTKEWQRKTIRIRYSMPYANEGIFPVMDNNREVVAKFLEMQSSKK